MNLPSSRFIERAAETLGDELSQIQNLGAKAANQFVKDTGKLAKRARYQLRNGASRAVELEEQVVNDLRTRPLAYILVAVGLASVIGLKILFDRQRTNSQE